jgi:hypothetical protein
MFGERDYALVVQLIEASPSSHPLSLSLSLSLSLLISLSQTYISNIARLSCSVCLGERGRSSLREREREIDGEKRETPRQPLVSGPGTCMLGSHRDCVLTGTRAPHDSAPPQRKLYVNCSDKSEHEETPGFQNLCFCPQQCSWDRGSAARMMMMMPFICREGGHSVVARGLGGDNCQSGGPVQYPRWPRAARYSRRHYLCERQYQ